MGVMSTPDRPDDAHIADTTMFRRFVDSESQIEQQEEKAARSRLWIWIASIALVVIVAVVVWLVLS
jgi:uncharacterized membrane protein YidH (DUF202 family)